VPIEFENISDTLTNVAQTIEGGERPDSQLNELTDAEMKRRNTIRIVIVLVVLSLLGLLIIKKLKK